MARDGNNFDNLKGEPQVALTLAAGASYRSAASATGVSPRTVARRMNDPAYARHVRQLRSDMIEGASGRLASLTMKAAVTLGKLLDSDADQTTLGAARAILDQAGRYRELVELSERVEAIESMLAESGGVKQIGGRRVA